MDLSYILNELGEDRQQVRGAVTPPIFQTSNFCFPSVAEMRTCLANEMDNPFYTRGHNPTVATLRAKIAALEGAEDALVFASGSAAMAAAIMSQLKQGDHVVCVKKPYSWTNTLLNSYLARFGVETTMIDGEVVENWAEAIRPNTRLFVLESPNSVTFEMQDIAAVASLAKSRGIRTVLDNSYASPLNQQPIALGIDLVCHSATKYLAGHSDVVAGVVAGSRALIEEIFHGEFMTLGGIISPHDAWLLIRGLRTLEIRMERVAKTTASVVSFLENHPRVSRVIYPTSSSHPQYELAMKQMPRGGGLFSAELKANSIEEMERFCDALKYFLLACSWGGYESLIFPTCVLYTSQNYSKTTQPWTLIRFYVGLEDEKVLIEDLERGFAAMEG